MKVKQTDRSHMGVTKPLQGGEGRVTNVCEDRHGTYYEVQMLYGKQKRRVVRRDGLVVHRKKGKRKPGGGRRPSS